MIELIKFYNKFIIGLCNDGGYNTKSRHLFAGYGHTH